MSRFYELTAVYERVQSKTGKLIYKENKLRSENIKTTLANVEWKPIIIKEMRK